MFKVFPIFYAMENCILPKNLQRRVNRLINVTQSNEEHQEQSENSKSPDEDSLKCSYDDDITSLMTKSHPKHANRNQKKPNWLVEFCQQNRKDRVKWNSKLHHDKTRFTKKTMYEQAEDLIDIAADDFAEEINKLCEDESQHLSKEMIKRLFAIEIESDLSHSMQVNTMVRRAVRPELAIMFDCPQLSIEHSIRRLMAEDKKLSTKIGKYHAFGRCLSPTSKQFRADKMSKPEPFDFPPDIRTGKMLFHGIEHLRSTRALNKHLDEKNLSKPQYLTSNSAFHAQHNQNTSDYTPLHTMFQ